MKPILVVFALVFALATANAGEYGRGRNHERPRNRHIEEAAKKKEIPRPATGPHRGPHEIPGPGRTVYRPVQGR